MLIDQLAGPIYYRILIIGAPADRDYAERLVGGHFAAMEVPDLLVGDVREFFRPLR